MTTPQEIQSLHRLYVDLTGLNIRLDMAREQDWFLWLKRGFTPQDLRDLVAHLRRDIRAGRRNPGCLKFRNLICNPDFFEEDLAEARSQSRTLRAARQSSSDRSQVLAASGRPKISNPKPGIRADAIAQKVTNDPAAAASALEELRRLKDSL